MIENAKITRSLYRPRLDAERPNPSPLPNQPRQQGSRRVARRVHRPAAPVCRSLRLDCLSVRSLFPIGYRLLPPPFFADFFAVFVAFFEVRAGVAFRADAAFFDVAFPPVFAFVLFFAATADFTLPVPLPDVFAAFPAAFTDFLAEDFADFFAVPFDADLAGVPLSPAFFPYFLRFLAAMDVPPQNITV